MLEFNPDGSLKLSASQSAQKDIENRSVVISREQLSEKPARAQIKIRFPEPVTSPDSVLAFYYKIDNSQFRDVEHKMEKVNDQTFIIKVEKGSMLMYNLLNFMMMCFKSKLEQASELGPGKKVILQGRWASFG